MEDFHPNKKAHPAFQVRGADSLRQRLVVRKVEVNDDQPLQGAIRFYVNDPFGNRLEFFERTSEKANPPS